MEQTTLQVCVTRIIYSLWESCLRKAATNHFDYFNMSDRLICHER